METSKKIDDLLKSHLSADHHAIEAPSLDFMQEARNRVMSYKTSETERLDFFALLASFLNLKIKLYHAAIALAIIYAALLFLKKEPAAIRHELSSTEQVSGLAAVRNSTVLSCIQTFVSPK